MNNYFTVHHKIFYLQILAHAGLIYQIFNGTFADWIITLIVYFLCGCLGLVVTYHRLLAHNSWPAKNWMRRLGSVLGSYSGVGPPIGWVAVHRAHHKYVDTIKDPHSPKHKGFVHVHWLGMFDNAGVEHAVDMLRDKFQMFLYKNYFRLHLAVGLIWLLIDPVLFVCAYLAPMALIWEMGVSVNSINHCWGYQNRQSTHSAYNNHFTGYLFFGEGWHANHHDHPIEPSTKERWWEFDLSGSIIKLLSK
jgi:stearoyl-CoA desaturase (delta-9 desaturase)